MKRSADGGRRERDVEREGRNFGEASRLRAVLPTQVEGAVHADGSSCRGRGGVIEESVQAMRAHTSLFWPPFHGSEGLLHLGSHRAG